MSTTNILATKRQFLVTQTEYPWGLTQVQCSLALFYVQVQHGSIAYLEHHEMSVRDFKLDFENIK